MKIKHIVLLVIAAIAVGVVFSTFTDSSTYADFSQARENPGRDLHIIGTLDTTQEVHYDPAQPNYLSFYMTDSKGETSKVVYYNAKPQDFEKSDNVVITGKMKDNHFEAGTLLLKCPSKYNDEEKPEAFGEKTF